MSLKDLKVGDRVQVFEQWTRNVPPGGWDGEVVKKGTKLITVKYNYSTSVFRIDTGAVNSKDFPYHARIRTVEQAQEDLRRSDLIQELRDLGLQFTNQGTLTTEQIEAVVRALKECE